MSWQPVLTEETSAASYGERDDHSITNLERCDIAPDLLNNSHKFMPKNHVLFLWKKAVVNMEVRTADRGGCDSQDNVLGMLDLRLWYVIN